METSTTAAALRRLDSTNRVTAAVTRELAVMGETLVSFAIQVHDGFGVQSASDS
jgi:hypothetical protein